MHKQDLVVPFFGGMPMCHGSGGLAGQHFFGARTGETCSIAALFSAFPQAIIGAMILLVGIELTKFAKDVRFNRELVPMATTVVLALAFNMAVGFFAGLLVYHAMYYIIRKRNAAEVAS